MSCIASRSNAHTYCISFFFFFNDTATTEIYTLSLHDALPICQLQRAPEPPVHFDEARLGCAVVPELDHRRAVPRQGGERSEEHTSELQSLAYLVCRLLLEKKKYNSHPQSDVVQQTLDCVTRLA